jgi:predicted DNA-binding transcriptional regulator YafY
VIASKPDPLRRRAGDVSRQQQIVARALDATLHHRSAQLTYHSKSSDRTKTYVVHPYRLAYAQGGLYLLAYVPEYREVRTFAVERIHDMSLLEDHFTPIEELPDEAFPHSMGVHSGPPEEVEIEFQSAIADYVKSREWHPSQQLSERPDASVVMKLHVCLDQALHSWILSFGPFARVRSPEHLATIIAKQLEDAHLRYADTGTT